VGTGPTADLRLTDKTVSREHVRLSLDAQGLRVEDDGSRNGTWVGGARIQAVLLTADTALRLGDTTLAVRLDPGPSELPLSAEGAFGDAIGISAAMRHVFALLGRAASSDVTVLFEGESGVGKDVLANALHKSSKRAEGPFVAIDCGAIPENLIESELFGHRRGAFTGAVKEREGLLVQARGGTVFLDEIGELPLALQPKLLRVLEQREVRPLGAHEVESVDARIVAATNRRLLGAVAEGTFRQDLYYRLAVARIVVPPLRDRPDDIVPLATAFLRTLTGDKTSVLPADLAALLVSYAWPGNVRELRNVMDRYALFGIRDAHGLFDSHAAGGTGEDLSALPFEEARRRAIDRFERFYVPRVLERAGNNMARAAGLAGVARPSFYRMVERVGLKRSKGEDEGD
jgi:transcriptional regulator with PAS, ATPase and Fis domain